MWEFGGLPVAVYIDHGPHAVGNSGLGEYLGDSFHHTAMKITCVAVVRDAIIFCMSIQELTGHRTWRELAYHCCSRNFAIHSGWRKLAIVTHQNTAINNQGRCVCDVLRSHTVTMVAVDPDKGELTGSEVLQQVARIHLDGDTDIFQVRRPYRRHKLCENVSPGCLSLKVCTRRTHPVIYTVNLAPEGLEQMA